MAYRSQTMQNAPLDHNTLPSFGACCQCTETPANQCIFLRGWQIRGIFRFAEVSLTVPISVENVRNVEWRRAQLIKGGKKRRDREDPSNVIRRGIAEHSSRSVLRAFEIDGPQMVTLVSNMVLESRGEGDAIVEEVEGTPADPKHVRHTRFL